MSQDLFRAAAEAGPDALFIFSNVRDPDGTLVNLCFAELNSQAESLVSMERASLIGRKLTDVFLQKQNQGLLRRLLDVSEKRSPLELEVPNSNRQVKARWLRLHAAALTEGVAVWARDISAAKKADEILADHQTEVLNAFRMSALSEMASGVAHEINNPLAIVQALTEHLQSLSTEGPIDVATLLSLSKKIQTNVERVAKVTRGLLAFSRDAENDPFHEVPFQRILDTVLELCGNRFRNNEVDFQIKPFDQELMIQCRSLALSQAILNLLLNAFDATQKQLQREAQRWIRLEVKDLGNHVSIEIADSGPGVPEKIRRKIMEPFFTTKEIGKGTGLGLSAAKGIIEGHGGTLIFEETSPFTLFKAILPKRQDSAGTIEV
ncbi:MAG: ATP-binding protein [Oligoflexia bacterium]|nr:ATP-binding protein [Oligoflexia bacterium]